MIEESLFPDEPELPPSSLPQGAVPEPLEIREFLGDAATVHRQSGLPASPIGFMDRPVCGYCAVVEAGAWFFGVMLVQMIGGVVVTFVLLSLAAATTKNFDIQRELHNPVMMERIIAGSLGVFVLTTLFAYWLRYYGRAFRELNLSLPDPRHVMIVVFATLPLSFCVSGLCVPIQSGWNYLVEIYPDLKILDGLSAMKHLNDLAGTMSFITMVVLFAVSPAISEEIVFRGAIGRVLIANLGLWGGVLLTSILFGLAHIHPVHVLAVIPLGIAIHCLYLATRSFWMPMLLHFLNNTWATFAAQSKVGDPVHDGAGMTGLEMFEMVSAVFAVVLLGVALWQSRVRLFDADGKEWKSARFPLRVPTGTDVHRKAASMNLLVGVAAIVCVVVCHVAVTIDLLRPAAPENEDGIQARTIPHQRLSFQTDVEIVA